MILDQSVKTHRPAMTAKKRTKPSGSSINSDALEKYVGFLYARRLTEAEKTLEEVRSLSNGSSQKSAGYLKALEGLLLSRKANGDAYIYLNRIEPTAKNYHKLNREFSRNAKSVLQGEYDRGYFQALAESMQILEKLSPQVIERKKS